MELTGEQRIPQVQAQVWEALNDPVILRHCITGCESLEAVSPTEYRVVIAAAIGPVRAKFNGKLALLDIVAPDSYALNFQGSGGAAGFGKGDAKVSLFPDGQDTLLHYQVNVQVGGKLAQIGSRLIDGVARKLAEEFFDAFNKRVGRPAAHEPPPVIKNPGQAALPPAHPVREAAPAIEQPQRKTWLWVAVGTAIVIAVGALII